MDAFLIEKFEEEGGQRTEKQARPGSDDIWGAEFMEREQAIRAIARVSSQIGAAVERLDTHEFGRAGERQIREDLENAEKYLGQSLSIQSYGLGWIVS